MEEFSLSSLRPLPMWPKAVAVVSVVAADAIVLVYGGGPWGWRVFAALLSSVAVAALFWGNQLLQSRAQILGELFERSEAKVGEVSESVQSRESEIARLNGEIKRRTAVFEGERKELVARLAQSAQESSVALEELAALQKAWGQLRDQTGTLAAEHAEAVRRRQLLQAQYQDLEKASRELGASHAERSAQYRAALDSAEQVRAELERLRGAEVALTGEGQKLRHQVERYEQERRTFEFRERALREETETLRRNLAEAKNLAQAEGTHRALSEELSARRVELDRLSDEMAHQREQVQLVTARAELAERAREETTAAFIQLQQRLTLADVVIGELQDEVRNVSQEARTDLARHFTWRLNYFENEEVRLNFINEGAALDLVDLRCEPVLPCVFEGPRSIARGGEGSVVIRPPPRTKVPPEFQLVVRYSIRSQEAAFRISPYAPNKIERL